MRIIDLTSEHLEKCVDLFMDGLQRQAAETSSLEIGHIRGEDIHKKLSDLVSQNGGVAVTDNTKLIGYMTGWEPEGFLGGHKGAYSPEWAHAARTEDAFGTYRAMYQAIGQRWVDHGCLTHAVNLLYVDSEPRSAFSWNGFGFICIDAVRNIDPIGVLVPSGLYICPMQAEDVEAWLPMQQGVNIHLASSPAFKPDLESKTAQQLAEWLSEPGHQAWIAWKGKRSVGYIQCEPVEPGAAWVVQGEGSFAVNGAFVYPEERAGGIAKALLSTMMLWARDVGMHRCSVDFETANLESCNFWLRHFQPVCVSMVRRLDERILPTHRFI